MKKILKIFTIGIIAIGTFLSIPGSQNLGQYFPPSSGGGTPGGSNTQVQYNNSSAFGGISGATTDGTTLTLVAPILGTPASATLTNATGLPVSTGISGLGSNVAAWLASATSANLATAVTNETGTGSLVFSTTPTFDSTATLGTPSGTTGALYFRGTTSGTAILTVGAAAGTPTLTLPTATGTLATLAGTETLTNKSIVGTQLTGTAYTFAANNTNGTAAYTLNAFEDHPIATYTGTDTWNGTPPTTSVSKQYAWSRIGNLVTLSVFVQYSGAGTTNTQVNFTLPSDCPTPVTIGGMGGSANDVTFNGVGRLEGSITGNPGASRAFMKKNSGNTAFEVVVISASASGKVASFTIQYRTS